MGEQRPGERRGALGPCRLGAPATPGTITGTRTSSPVYLVATAAPAARRSRAGSGTRRPGCRPRPGPGRRCGRWYSSTAQRTPPVMKVDMHDVDAVDGDEQAGQPRPPWRWPHGQRQQVDKQDPGDPNTIEGSHGIEGVPGLVKDRPRGATRGSTHRMPRLTCGKCHVAHGAATTRDASPQGPTRRSAPCRLRWSRP